MEHSGKYVQHKIFEFLKQTETSVDKNLQLAKCEECWGTRVNFRFPAPRVAWTRGGASLHMWCSAPHVEEFVSSGVFESYNKKMQMQLSVKKNGKKPIFPHINGGLSNG